MYQNMEISKRGSICTFLRGVLLLISMTTSANIRLFKDINYSDLHLEINATNACHNVPTGKTGTAVFSIITDTCFIAHNLPSCNGSWTNKYMPGKTLPPAANLGPHGNIKSVQVCNEQEGGPKLNIDITTHLENKYPPVFPNVLDRYYDVCTCFNVPKYVEKMTKWSINNHGNGLFAYFEPNCAEKISKALYIDAGYWTESKDMHTHIRIYRGVTLKVQSFGPASNCTYFQQSCLAYQNDKIMKIELLGTSNNSNPQNEVNSNTIRTDFHIVVEDDPINFFGDQNYQGFHFGARSTVKCKNFSKPVLSQWVNGVGSIKTEICMMLYSAYDCMGRSVKIEAPGTTNLTTVWESTTTGADTLSLLYNKYPNWSWETKSYQVCYRDIGGLSLNVDIISSDPNVEPTDGPIILESYRNLCTCINVPKYIQQLDQWSVNNYGNSMIAYFSPNCSSSTHSSLRIPAGHSSFSFGLGSFKNVDAITGFIHKIQSIGPDPNAEYFHRSCSNNFTTLSIFERVNTTRLNGGSICDSGTAIEGTLLGLLCMQVLSELQQISNQVDELKQINQRTGFYFENAKSYFEGQLQSQRDEYKNLTNKIKDDLQELFA